MRYHISKLGTGDADVLHLARKSADIQHPVILDVFDHWEVLRAGRLAPLRSELDPRKISHVIDHVFVLEYKSPLDVRFRLAGMALCKLLGMELRGMPARALFGIGHRDELGRVLDDIVTAPKIIELVLKSPSQGAPELGARMLLLPMQSVEGQYSRILGCLVSDDPALQVPARFDITKVNTTRIVGAMAPSRPRGKGHEPTRNPAQTAHSVPQTPNAFQEPPLCFESLRKPEAGTKSATRRLAAGKPYLRLIKDG
ncbi:PAS domain-containing protein [Neptunicoccus cionae]|uniref:PAS domain-containing protein n=1 Tax=Neptunicoccus cionae TaxID=2035344 RepID=A0A916QWW3_9RHOB|nr:PAS domain-containing protein [Amylibacter cionae]GGA14622.1 hypothetical protein GCM10011498_13540 [Amylibacter cionae]